MDYWVYIQYIYLVETMVYIDPILFIGLLGKYYWIITRSMVDSPWYLPGIISSQYGDSPQIHYMVDNIQDNSCLLLVWIILWQKNAKNMVYHYKWRFPKIGVPRNHPFVDGIFHYKPSILGSSHLEKPSKWIINHIMG